jgi:hypothetical protein
VETVESALTYLPIFVLVAKLVNPGLEATMMAISGSIVSLNKLTIRALVGVAINNSFVGVDKNSLNDFY